MPTRTKRNLYKSVLSELNLKSGLFLSTSQVCHTGGIAIQIVRTIEEFNRPSLSVFAHLLTLWRKVLLTARVLIYRSIKNNCVHRMFYISESLRLWPPLVVLDRHCNKDYNLGKPNDNASEDFIVSTNINCLYFI